MQVPQVFELVEEFVSEVAVSSKGRLLLLNGEPGGGMFCLEFDRRVSAFFWGFVGVVLCSLCARSYRGVFIVVSLAPYETESHRHVLQ